MRLHGKVVVVTGAGSGIGRATALLLAREGARVVIADLNEAPAQETVREVQGQGHTAAAVAVDVADSGRVQQMVRFAVETFGGLDILVNNAMSSARGRVTDLSEEEWERSIAATLTSVFLCSKYAIPHMQRAGGGAIINIASVQGLVAMRRNAAYNAAKGGMINLTRNMALDYAQERIRVNCICPGAIATRSREVYRTSLADRQPPPQYPEARTVEEVELMHPLGRMGTPEEVAQAMLYLASEEASFVTGAALVVDGGLTVQVLA